MDRSGASSGVDLVAQLSQFPHHLRGGVAALGNFDGFHRGHQAIAGEAGRLARAAAAPLIVVTNEPHPRQVFKPDAPHFRLTTAVERAALLDRFGVDGVFSLPFDRTVARMSAQDFVTRVLLEGLGVRHVVAGYNFRFGQGRAGGPDVLAWMGEMEDFGVTILPPVGDGNTVFSSTDIREALIAGAPRRAAGMLGHWWTVIGRVDPGDRRGRSIGFPTANLAMGERLRPAFGVYAVRARLAGQTAWLDGVANLGRRPTFDKTDELLEVHLLDFDGDIYGREMQVELVDFIRPERKFDGLDALKAQIAEDSEAARRRLADPANAREQLPPPTLDAYLAAHPASPGERP